LRGFWPTWQFIAAKLRIRHPQGTGCVRYDKTGETVTVIDVTSGQTRAKIVKTAAGNAEKLAP
jgi:hypothetical protein